MTRRLARLLALPLFVGAACAPLPEEQSEWEREHLAPALQERQAALPAYPADTDLVEFAVPESAGFRFFIDAASLAVGDDGIVRYVLLARSPNGVDNVSFEGLRCATGEYRLYAVARSDRTWSARAGSWQRVSAASGGPWRLVLRRDFFCPGDVAIGSREEGLRALREQR